MFDDMKTKGALQKINAGGTAELSKSQIVLSLVNLNAVFKPMKRDDFKRMPDDDRKRVNAIMDWYKDIRADKTKETYDKAKLDEVSAQILAELKELQGPTQEEIEADVKANDRDVKEAENIDIDDFFGDNSSSSDEDVEDGEDGDSDEDGEDGDSDETGEDEDPCESEDNGDEPDDGDADK